MISLAAKQGGETNFKKEPIKRSVRYPWEILEPPILKGGKKLGPHVGHIRSITGGDNTQTGVVWSPTRDIYDIAHHCALEAGQLGFYLGKELHSYNLDSQVF